MLHDRSEFGREQFVGFIHDENGTLAEVSDALTGKVEDTSRCTDENVDVLAETHDIVLESCPSGSDHDLSAHVLSEQFAYLGRLKGEFSSGDKEEGLNLWFLDVDLLEGGDNKSGSFARSVLGPGENVTFGERDGDRLFLDRRRFFETSFEDTHE